VLEQPALPFRRQLGVDRQVGRAGQVNAQHRHHLLPALGQEHRHQLVRAHHPFQQRFLDGGGAGIELAVGEAPRGCGHRQVPAALAHLQEEGQVQELVGQRGGGGVGLLPSPGLRRRQQMLGVSAQRALPGGVVLRQVIEQTGHHGLHVVQQTGREELIHRVPAHQEGAAAGLLHDAIERHLRRLGEAEDRFAQPVGPGGAVAAVQV
jgi:hypothetical protein